MYIFYCCLCRCSHFFFPSCFIAHSALFCFYEVESHVKLENVNKISKRTGRNLLVASAVTTNVNDIIKQIALPSPSSKPGGSACQDDGCVADKLQREKKSACVIWFFPTKDLNSSDIQHEISADYLVECTFKAEIYNWVVKFKIGMTSLHDTSYLRQGCSALVADNRFLFCFFFVVLIALHGGCWTCGSNA